MTARRRGSALAAVFFATVAVGGPASPAYATGSVVTTIAGNGVGGYTGDGGQATSAELSTPAGVTIASNGDIYIADAAANVVRMVSQSGVISTVAGTGTAGYSGDGGLATAATLRDPTDVAIGPDGSLYIADGGNHVIREIDNGVISTVPITGTNPMAQPAGLDLDPAGDVYVADYSGASVYKIDTSGTITRVAGNGTAGYSGDGGPAKSAELNRPGDVVYAAGTVYIADSVNHRVRAVDSSGTITTFAGTGTSAYTGDGGPASAAALEFPVGLADDSNGDVFIADYGTSTVRKVAPGGTITTVAGTGTAGYTGDGGDPTSATFYLPARVNLDPQGDLYVSDYGNHVLRQITSLGTPAQPPGTPTGVTATGGDGQAVVSWTPPNDDGREPVTSYDVTPHHGGVADAPTTVNGSTSSTTITGLTDGTAYTFTVTATNSVGTSAESAPSSPVTPAGVPSAPTGLTATAGNAQATVSWTAPANNGGFPVTSYDVTPHHDGVSDAPTTVGGSTTSTTINGLTNGTAYTFTVTATNSVGTSADSTPSSPVTPKTVPNAPTGVTATAGNAQADVSWAAPANDGGSPITSYAVTAHHNGITDAPVTVSGSTTSTTISGLTDGTIYTFTVTATNSVGTSPDSNPSSAITPAAVPSAPTGVTATAGAGQADLSWTAPADTGGFAVTSYDVTPHHNGADDAPITVNGSTTSTTITGLTNGTTYTFTVSATNSVGPSPDSNPSAPVTPGAAPDAPTNVSATAGDAQADVSWNAPANDGGFPVTSYDVTPHHGGVDDAPMTVNGSTTSTTISGLTNGTTYTFTVAATNSIGTSADSTPSSPVTPQAPQPPNAPTSVSASADNAQATVSWNPPSDDGGSPITSYDVTPHHNGTSDTPVTVGASNTSTTITGLSNGTSYTFTVTATNAIGTSPHSNPSSPVTPSMKPSAPTSVTAVAGDGQATVSWSAPSDDGGSSITSYDVTPHHGGTADFPVTAGGSQTSLTITGLTNGTSYTFTVTATNQTGTSADSSPSAAVTPATAPDAPTGVAATAGNAKATVSWSAPANDGGAAITSYSVTPHHGGVAGSPITVSGTSRSTSVTGLTNGTAYTFTVTATNWSGTSLDSTASAPVTPAGSVPPPPVTRPDAPTSVSAAVAGQDVSVRWAAPTQDGGAPIRHYLVVPHHGGVSGAPIVVSGSARSAKVTGLHLDTTYTFTVKATNAAGTSPPSSPSNSVLIKSDSGGSGNGGSGNGGSGNGGSGNGGSGGTGSGGTGDNGSAGGPGAQTGTGSNGTTGPTQQTTTTTPTGTVFGGGGATSGGHAAHRQHRARRHHHASQTATPAPGGWNPIPGVVAGRSPQSVSTHHSPLSWAAVATVASAVSKNTAVPVTLLILVGLFLLVQNRLDNRDPKLALAPVYADPGVTFVPGLA